VKRILLVAPGVVPPWTEGRKNFVRDLASVLPVGGCEVEIIDGAPRGMRSLVDRLLAPLRACWTLRARLARLDAPVSVALFPYGRFSGAIGLLNRLFLRAARRTCAAERVQAVVVFYSAAGLALDDLDEYTPAFAVGREAPGVRAIPLGITHEDRAWPASAAPKRALFLCGYQDASPSVLEAVLEERGLRDLLRAGSALGALGLKLTIAIPFLRDARMRERLMAEAALLCPSLDIELDAATAPLDALCSHDVYLFPYRADHAVFVPTSLLEAFSVGIPVIAADHAMYEALSRGDGETRCALHRAGDARDLARVAAGVVAEWNAATVRASTTRAWVRETWTLRRSAAVLLGAVAPTRG
jgi:glycosyltransferase involved in cell wall biosynthesis